MTLPNIKRKKNIIITLVLSVILMSFPHQIKADTGNVYTCKINPSYSHPVTGDVEDSGGKSSMATGQGMVEGVVGAMGMLEVTDSGKYYLTIKMSLIDFTSKQSFKVQKRGASSWSETKMGITSQGKDSNGTTADICIEIPDKDSIVRGTMYVEPMGRDVIYYFTASDFKEGKPDDMKATMVTEKSTGKNNEINGNGDELQENNQNLQNEAKLNNQNSDDINNQNNADSSNQNISENKQDANASETVTQNNSEKNADGDVKGLSLSTDSNTVSDTAGDSVLEDGSAQKNERTMTEDIFVLTLSITMAGLILICAAVGAIYFCRKNWNRWGGDMFED